MTIITPAELKKFLRPTEYKCSEKKCPFKTIDGDEFTMHSAEHAIVQAENETKKYAVVHAKPNEKLVNMLEKIIE